MIPISHVRFVLLAEGTRLLEGNVGLKKKYGHINFLSSEEIQLKAFGVMRWAGARVGEDEVSGSNFYIAYDRRTNDIVSFFAIDFEQDQDYVPPDVPFVERRRMNGLTINPLLIKRDTNVLPLP